VILLSHALHVGTCNVNFPIRLEALHCDLKCMGSECVLLLPLPLPLPLLLLAAASTVFALMPSACSFDMEVFPGLRLRLHDLGVTLLIFNSGRLVFAGASTYARRPKLQQRALHHM
jgi:hypothetical protein